MVQMETAEDSAETEKSSERLLFSEECQLITFMSVVRGKLEATRCVLGVYVTIAKWISSAKLL
jgi:hypothetical protein